MSILLLVASGIVVWAPSGGRIGASFAGMGLGFAVPDTPPSTLWRASVTAGP